MLAALQVEFDQASNDSSKFDALLAFAKSKSLTVWWMGLVVLVPDPDTRLTFVNNL